MRASLNQITGPGATLSFVAADLCTSFRRTAE
jgi:hypothetical protein